MNELKSFISDSEKISIRKQCELLEISRSIYYYQPRAEKPENLHFMRLMDEFWLKHSAYGVLQMQDFLRSQGYSVNHKRMRRLLRKMGVI